MLANILLQHRPYYPVVEFNRAQDRLLPMDFTANNKDLTQEILDNTGLFSAYINHLLARHGCRYGIGGYAEHRTIYARSAHFNAPEEPRRLHLGIDIWGPAGTPVYAPLDGYVHSFRFNDHYGDYGPTIILAHRLKGLTFHTLYGHLSLPDLEGLHENKAVKAGQLLAHFGQPHENGNWPPHLHFQVIENMQGYKGDYPGVCRYSERQQYLANCPNPGLLLQLPAS